MPRTIGETLVEKNKLFIEMHKIQMETSKALTETAIETTRRNAREAEDLRTSPPQWRLGGDIKTGG